MSNGKLPPHIGIIGPCSTISLNTIISSVKHFQETADEEPINFQKLEKYVDYKCDCGDVIVKTTTPYHCKSCHAEYRDLIKDGVKTLDKLE